MTFLFPVWDRWNHNKYLVQITNPVIAIPYNKLWWPSGKDTRLSHRQSGFKSRWDLFEEKFFLYLCFTKNLIPKSRNLYLSTPMDDFRGRVWRCWASDETLFWYLFSIKLIASCVFMMKGSGNGHWYSVLHSDRKSKKCTIKRMKKMLKTSALKRSL